MKTDYQTFTTKQTSEKERNRLYVGDYWSNSVQCAMCGEIIRSCNRHDFVKCSCGEVSVDGGSFYLRRLWVSRPEQLPRGAGAYIELSELYDDCSQEEKDRLEDSKKFNSIFIKQEKVAESTQDIEKTP